MVNQMLAGLLIAYAGLALPPVTCEKGEKGDKGGKGEVINNNIRPGLYSSRLIIFSVNHHC